MRSPSREEGAPTPRASCSCCCMTCRSSPYGASPSTTTTPSVRRPSPRPVPSTSKRMPLRSSSRTRPTRPRRLRASTSYWPRFAWASTRCATRTRRSPCVTVWWARRPAVPVASPTACAPSAASSRFWTTWRSTRPMPGCSTTRTRLPSLPRRRAGCAPNPGSSTSATCPLP